MGARAYAVAQCSRVELCAFGNSLLERGPEGVAVGGKEFGQRVAAWIAGRGPPPLLGGHALLPGFFPALLPPHVAVDAPQEGLLLYVRLETQGIQPYGVLRRPRLLVQRPVQKRP